MNIRKSLAVVALVAFAASAAHAAMTVMSFTGTLVIKSGGKTVTYKAGDKVPALNKGDSVTVKDGTAEFFDPHYGSISAGAGAGFTYSEYNKVTVTAGSITAMTRDGVPQTVKAGEDVSFMSRHKALGPVVVIVVTPTPPAQDQSVVTPVSPSAP